MCPRLDSRSIAHPEACESHGWASLLASRLSVACSGTFIRMMNHPYKDEPGNRISGKFGTTSPETLQLREPDVRPTFAGKEQDAIVAPAS